MNSADRYGRRLVILSASLVFLVGAVVMGAAPEKVTLLVGRIIVGIGIETLQRHTTQGILTLLVPHTVENAFEMVSPHGGDALLPHSVIHPNVSETIEHTLLQGLHFHSHRVVLHSQLLTLNVATCDLPTLLAVAGVHPSRQHAVIRLTCAFLRKTGLASMVVPVYLSEVSPVEIRGRVTVVNNIFITGGQLVSSIISGAFSEVPMGWRYMLGLAGIPALLQLIGSAMMPESPRWLISQGR
ncbi:Proton myo-inositol cotransporter [Chionoecetes opilio]|uniref:Proton myo-inositol cotransporter n=1 Tax=Chionoecetes opilio TaxID=41210 RepID=A0A8J4YKT9_CHIOP|nr:Proton myo-inositol cotransporter [Chionoecetes opilio]